MMKILRSIFCITLLFANCQLLSQSESGFPISTQFRIQPKKLQDKVYMQGRAIPIEVEIENTTCNEAVFTIDLWRENNISYEITLNGVVLPRLQEGRATGASLGKRIKAGQSGNFSLFPGLYYDLTQPGTYEVGIDISGVIASEIGMPASDRELVELESISDAFIIKVIRGDRLRANEANEKWIKELSSQNRDEVDEALRALISTRTNSAAEVIYSMSLANRDFTNGFYSLARMKTHHSVELLGLALESEESWVILKVLREVGNFYILSLEERVQQLLNSEDARVREKAKEVLERLDFAKNNQIKDTRFPSPVFSKDSQSVQSAHHSMFVKESDDIECKETAVVTNARPPEESTGQPSNWWLWLIGALIVGAGFLIIRSRK